MTRCQTFTHMNITLSTLVDSTHISSLYIHVYCRCIEHITIIIIILLVSSVKRFWNLIPKGLDYTQIGTLPEPCVTILWFWEVLGQGQCWLRTKQMDLWKLYIILASMNLRQSVPNSKSCACANRWLCCLNKICSALPRRMLSPHKFWIAYTPRNNKILFNRRKG